MGELLASELVSYRKTGFERLETENDASCSRSRMLVSLWLSSDSVLVPGAPVLQEKADQLHFPAVYTMLQDRALPTATRAPRTH